jgi:hypothetical protein
VASELGTGSKPEKLADFAEGHEGGLQVLSVKEEGGIVSYL